MTGPSRSSSIRERGFSLLGVIIAFAFVVLVVVAIAGLGQRTSSATRATKERFIATSLAREGIELVRAIRDSNWLAAPHCASEPCTIYWRGGDPLGTTKNVCNGTWRVDAETVELVSVTAGGSDTRIYRQDLVYSYDASGRETPFRRWVEIASADAGCPPASSVSTLPPPPPFTARATVQWTARDGSARTVMVAEELYPWMRFR